MGPAPRPVRARSADLGARRHPRGFPQPIVALRPRTDRSTPSRSRSRIPLFAEAGIRTVVNGPDAYTPDGRCLMGPVPGLRDFHVLAGFSIFGVVFAGGAGRYAAEWIVDGQPSDNMWELDVRRFGPTRTRPPTSSPGRPRSSRTSTRSTSPRRNGRPAGRSSRPALRATAREGAVFGVRSGGSGPSGSLERARARRVLLPPRQLVRGGRRGVPAVRSTVGVLDQTSFAKFLDRRPGAEAVPRPPLR